MSEYQCYEFVALDRSLTPKQLAELRAISTRAEISPTRFWNEYQWGDLKADPAKLMARYFDAHLYCASASSGAAGSSIGGSARATTRREGSER